MQAPTIRPSLDADVPAVTDIYAHHVETGTASFETEPPDEVEMRRRRDVLVKSRYPYFVAELGDEVCGYAYAGPYRTHPAYRHSVDADRRREGSRVRTSRRNAYRPLPSPPPSQVPAYRATTPNE